MASETIPWFPDGWEADAACRGADVNLFFAPHYFERKAEKDAREGQAKAFCRACPVRALCLEYALQTEERHGVWGGRNELERRRLLRRRAAAAAAVETPPDAAAG